MSEQETPPADIIRDEFLSWHLSAGSLHIRTASGRILYVDKGQDALIEKVKQTRRGQNIAITGTSNFSKTLSNYVIEVDSYEAA